MATAQNATFNKLVTTDTSATSLVVGGATPNATTGTGGVNCGPITQTSIKNGTTLLISATAPTIASGFGVGATIAGTANTFRVTMPAGSSSNGGVVNLPTATNGWNCFVEDLTANAANRADQRTVQISSTVNSATFQHQTVSTGAALAMADGDVLSFVCLAY